MHSHRATTGRGPPPRSTQRSAREVSPQTRLQHLLGCGGDDLLPPLFLRVLSRHSVLYGFQAAPVRTRVLKSARGSPPPHVFSRTRCAELEPTQQLLIPPELRIPPAGLVGAFSRLAWPPTTDDLALLSTMLRDGHACATSDKPQRSAIVASRCVSKRAGDWVSLSLLLEAVSWKLSQCILVCHCLLQSTSGFP